MERLLFKPPSLGHTANSRSRKKMDNCIYFASTTVKDKDKKEVEEKEPERFMNKFISLGKMNK